MSLSIRKITMRSRTRRFFQNLFIIFTATTAVMLSATIAVGAAENDELHEIETKYIFGTFTVGSSTGIEGEKGVRAGNPGKFWQGRRGTIFRRRDHRRP